MPSDQGLINKLAFTGYRVFIEERFEISGSEHRITHYKDLDVQACKRIEEDIGYFPSPREACEWMTERFRRSTISEFVDYAAKSTNDSNYNTLWEADWYKVKRQAGNK